MKKSTLNYLLNKFNITLEQLSDCTQISIYILKKATKDIKQLKSKNLIKLADFFNVSTDYLLEIEKNNKK